MLASDKVISPSFECMSRGTQTSILKVEVAEVATTLMVGWLHPVFSKSVCQVLRGKVPLR